MGPGVGGNGNEVLDSGTEEALRGRPPSGIASLTSRPGSGFEGGFPAQCRWAGSRRWRWAWAGSGRSRPLDVVRALSWGPVTVHRRQGRVGELPGDRGGHGIGVVPATWDDRTDGAPWADPATLAPATDLGEARWSR